MAIFGTAGHIDHGKTSVIYALTGIDADRLPEEKLRGLTIDLGFAWMNTSQGEKIGIIDVPGHEHFIRNMITGIASVDAFILVVDAKEGWKPQTEEHYQIIRLLDINYGLMVITKTDLVSKERVKEVEKEIRDKTKGLNQPEVPILYFSINDKESIVKLRSQVESINNTIPPKKDIGKPRLFIDRVFEIKGSGTVVTGTLLNGNLAQNQTVYLFPALKQVRLRQLQSYNTPTEKALSGNRIALNLPGIKKEDISRGDLISDIKKFHSGNFLEVSLSLLPQKDPYRLKNGTEIEFISHTKILRGIIVFKQKEIVSGEKSYAQIRFQEHIYPMIGDYFIIRLPGINETIGGGRLLAVEESKYNFHNQDWGSWLAKREKMDISQLILSELEKHPAIKKEELLVNSPFSSEEIYHHLEQLHENNSLFLVGNWVADKQFWIRSANQAIIYLEQKHKDYPLKPGISLTELKNQYPRVPEELFQGLLNYLAEENKVQIKSGMASSVQHTISLSAQQNKKREAILQYIAKDATNLPTEKELRNIFTQDTELIEYLLESGEILKLEDQICITPSLYQEMRDKIVEFLKNKQSITIGEVRDLLNISRKYIVPLLTRMDEEGITRRKENIRVLNMKGKTC